MRVLMMLPALIAAIALAGCAAVEGGGGPQPQGQPAPETASAPEGEPPDVPAIGGERVWSGAVSAAFNDMFVTARDQRGWELVWQLVGEQPPGPLPEGAVAVSVFLGSRPTGGYGVDIVGMSYREDQVLVFYRITEPPEGAAVTQALTAPYTVRLAPAAPARPVHYLLNPDP
jgi:hypothetical protein